MIQGGTPSITAHQGLISLRAILLIILTRQITLALPINPLVRAAVRIKGLAVAVVAVQGAEFT